MPSTPSARPATTTTARSSAIPTRVGIFLLAGALACGGCGDEPAPAPLEDDPWAEATDEVVDPWAAQPPGGEADAIPPAAPALKGALEDDAQRFARVIVGLEGRLDDHAVDWTQHAQRFGARALAAAPALRDMLLRMEPKVAAPAAAALEGIGSGGVPYLVAALESGSPWVRRLVLQSLARLGARAEDAVPHALACLRDDDLGVRCAAAHALGAFGKRTPDVESRLRAVLLTEPGPDDRGDGFRYVACKALQTLGAREAATLDAVERMARADVDDDLRLLALEVFWARNTDRDRGIELAAKLRHVPSMRAAAVERLVESGDDAPDVIEAYVESLPWRPTHEQKLVAAEHLVKTGPNGRKAAIDFAFVVLDWCGEDARKIRAAAVLAQSGPEGRAEPAVAEALWVHANPDNDTAPVVAACQKALRALGLPLTDPQAEREEDGEDDDE